MATTVAKAFDEFIVKVKPRQAQQDLVASRRKTVESYLLHSFSSSSNMPLRLTKFIGSAGRDTLIRPLDDVDVLAVFEPDQVWDTGFFKGYRYDSKTFLYRVRDALSKYSVKIVGARGQAVRLFYQQPPHVDVAAVFPIEGGSYFIPNGEGGWLQTNPDLHDSFLSQRNAELGYHLKPFVRILKRWNTVHSARLRSFHLEVLAQAIFKSIGANYREAAKLFFDLAPGHLHVQDPAGFGGDLCKMTWQQEKATKAIFQSSAERSARAVTAESTGDVTEALRLWRLVFGEEMPIYG